MTLTSRNNSSLTLASIGSDSMVGSRFSELSGDKFNLIEANPFSKIRIDITDRDSINSFFGNYKFDYFILWSAFTDVDEAEKQRGDKSGLCWRLNVESVSDLADLGLKHKRKFIFISTDFVFDGTSGPYSETDPPGGDLSKISWYGITKLEAEKNIQQKLSDYLILRISYPYRAKFDKKEDFARAILKRYQEGNLYPLFFDQKLTPTFIDDLSPALELLINKRQKGVFHLASSEVTTPYEFGRYLIEKIGGDPKRIEKGSLEDQMKNSDVAPRSINGGLKVEKISKLGFVPTNWKVGIEKVLSDFKN